MGAPLYVYDISRLRVNHFNVYIFRVVSAMILILFLCDCTLCMWAVLLTFRRNLMPLYLAIQLSTSYASSFSSYIIDNNRLCFSRSRVPL